MTGLCIECKVSPASRSGFCKPCYRRQYRHKTRLEQNGITSEWFDEHFKGVCEICGVAVGKYSVHLDHCHKTDEFRGFLCKKCNCGLGMFQDDANRLAKAMLYIANIK